jgi:hypothetical protein
MHRNSTFFFSRVARNPRPLSIAMLTILLSATSLVHEANAAPPTEPRLSKELSSIMRRDLGLNAQQAQRYVIAERKAIALTPKLKRQLGKAYAGSWMERDARGDFRLIVGVTDGNASAKAQALGAQTRLVGRSLAELDGAKAKLDAYSQKQSPSADIHSWYVDPLSNTLIIEGEPSAAKAALNYVAAAGIDQSTVRFVESIGRPVAERVVGGEQYFTNRSACSIGFPVVRRTLTGFATAGHCGDLNDVTFGFNFLPQGVFAKSVNPGSDAGWVIITDTSAWPLTDWVTDYAGGTIPVRGQDQASVGAAFCRSGANTGYQCGTILAHNVTINSTSGLLLNMSRSSACSGPGDSGGSVITPSGQAQGIHSTGMPLRPGETNSCGYAMRQTHYQPIVPLLNHYGLTLVTRVDPPQPLTITPVVCYTGRRRFECSVSYTSTSPATVSWSGAAGTAVDGTGVSDFTGMCRVGDWYTVIVTVTNSVATRSSSAYFQCSSGPLV